MEKVIRLIEIYDITKGGRECLKLKKYSKLMNGRKTEINQDDQDQNKVI